MDVHRNIHFLIVVDYNQARFIEKNRSPIGAIGVIYVKKILLLMRGV